jgi:hypothetical protein
MPILPSNPSDLRSSSKISDTVLVLQLLQYIRVALRARQSVLHRGIICAAPLLRGRWPIDAGHTVLDVTIGCHRRLKNSNSPGVECLADIGTYKFASRGKATGKTGEDGSME